ncbi:unnamed protein product [Closterium sp. NIES-53]
MSQPGSPPVFKAHYVAGIFSQRQGVDFFQTFSPTPKMTTLRGSLHEEIWLRRPPGFNGSFHASTQWSLRWPVYGLHQAPREWHDTLRTSLAALGFAPLTADLSLFLRIDTSLPQLYIPVYVDDLVFATADTENSWTSPQPLDSFSSSADPSLFVLRGSTQSFVLVYVDDLIFATPDKRALASVKEELQRRHTCTDLGEMQRYLGLQITRDRAVAYCRADPHAVLLPILQSTACENGRIWAKYVASTSGMVTASILGPELFCGGRLGRRLSPVPSCEAEVYAAAMAAQELHWLSFLVTDLGERPRSPPVLFANNKSATLLCEEPRLVGKAKHIQLCYFLLRELQQRGQARETHPLAEPVEVTVDSGAARGGAARGAASGGADFEGAEPGGIEPESAEPGGAEPEGAEPGGAESGGAEPGGAEPASVEPRGVKPLCAEPGGAEPEGTESGGVEPRGTASAGGPMGASPRRSRRRKPLSPQELRDWFARRTRLRSGAAGVGGPTARGPGAGGAGAASPGGTAGAGGTGAGGIGCAGAAGPGGARTGGTGAAGAGGAAGTRGAGGAGAASLGGARPGGTGAARAGGAAGAGAGGTGAGDPRAGGTGAGGTGAGDPGAGDSLTERRKPVSRPASHFRAVCPGRRIPRPLPPPVPGTHVMALRPSSIPQRVHLPSPPASSLADGPDPESDLLCAASHTVTRLLATVVTDPSFESTAASALVAKLVDFAAACHLDYAASLVAESESVCPSSVGGDCALGTDVLEDRQEEFECLAAAVPHLVAMLVAPEGDPDAPHIPTPRSYAEAIIGPYSSQWQAAMDAEMASWKSIGT